MHLSRSLTVDGVAALVLTAAAAVLVTTPYDGGACRNVAAAYAVPAASLAPAQEPAEPAALTDARQAVSAAQADVAALASKQADVEKAQQAAQQARDAADKAASAQTTDTSSIDGDLSVTQAQDDEELAQTEVDDDQSYLQTTKQDAADFPGDSYWTQEVQQAQSELDAANAKLSAAQQALKQAKAQQSSAAAAAASAQKHADDLSAQADAAEKAAEDAESSYAAQQSQVEENLSAAQSRETAQEADYRTTVATWSHERRLESDRVVALNNVRSSCRADGTWRASAAGVDVVLLAAIVLVWFAPRLRRMGSRAWARRPRLRR
jgi:chemotaxis protein histidine kinase CheA